MSLDLGTVKATDNMLQSFEAFICALPIPTDEEIGSFYHIITALGDSIKINYVTLRRALDEDNQIMLAWSCRNLLELAIWTKFALTSKANAYEFAADRLIDGKQIGICLKKLERSLNPNLKTSAFDEVIGTFARQMTNEGITRNRFLNMRDLARQVGLRDEYETMNQVCSKFVHPTAWSIFTAEFGSARFHEGSEIFYITGAHYFSIAIAEIMPHIREHGLKHKR